MAAKHYKEANKPLPDITNKLARLGLFAEYAIRKTSTVRFDLIHEDWRTDDWTWQNWTYSDGTRITQPPSQKVDFLGVSYYYRFQ